MPVQEDRTDTEKLGQVILQIKSRFDSGEIDGDSYQAEIERASKSHPGLWQKHIDYVNCLFKAYGNRVFTT